MPRVKIVVGENDLATTHPQIAARWSQKRNGALTPKEVTYGSRKKVWWTCHLGHEVFVEINYMANTNSCGICSGKIVLAGFNDFATVKKELLPFWHPSLNFPLTPSQITPGSKRMAWWICDRGHEWRAAVGKVSRGKRCPKCNLSQFRPGETDLATLFPKVAQFWHPEKNGNLTPLNVAPTSTRKVWWKCDQGHEAFQSIVYRTKANRCPICSGNVLSQGFNDLATTHPEMSASWHPTKNGPITPNQVTAGSHTKAWWLCREGHSTFQEIRYRLKTKRCPVCIGREVISGINDLATTHPELASEWNTSKNLEKQVDQVSFGSSGKQYWWTCSEGHDFRSAVAWRVQGNGCPVCANRVIVEGENDLQSQYPSLAQEWHSLRNGDLLPAHVGPGSSRIVWWKHQEGHEWRAAIYSRVAGNSCPVCSGRVTISGVNDLQTRFPELARTWHPSKNLPLSPDSVSAGSSSKVWWICDNDSSHEWQASISNRAKNSSGCPSCSTTGYDSTKPGILYFIQTVDGRGRKIGITNSGRKNDRVRSFTNRGWKILGIWESEDGQLIARAEASVLRRLRTEMEIQPYLAKSDLVGLAGYSETFSADYATDQEIKALIQKTITDFMSEIQD